jgi:diguanylate cyclase (GGDEF)-like protein
LSGNKNIAAKTRGSGVSRQDDRPRDTITLGIAVAAIILFVGTGGAAITQVVEAMQGRSLGPDNLLVSGLLLNIALIIFGWRRYRQLAEEVKFRRQAEIEAMQLAKLDPLTGLLNRRSLPEAADVLIADCAAGGKPVAMMMADLDSFKQINDIHGHAAGDAVLKQAAATISVMLPTGSLAARIGGDEIAFLVPFDSARPEYIDELATALIAAVAMSGTSETATIDVTLSMGIARSNGALPSSEESTTFSALMHGADIAMYHAKRQGRNQYFNFEIAMEIELRKRRELEAAIRSAITRGEFVPYYEQQIDLKSGKLTGFEMLARWDSAEYGSVGPHVFIEIAEEIGLIEDLSSGLIAKALQDAKSWNSQLTLSVNISPVQFRDPWFSQKLLKQLIEANFPPQRLEIEITESCMHENAAAVRTLLTSLKNQGVRISLDDFGTGYSSFGQLRALPIDNIKIDRSFVSQLLDSEDNATILRAISSLGEGLGIPITAEGIESPEVLAELQNFGDFRGQGHLYGRPESGAATAERLAAMNLLAAGQIATPDALDDAQAAAPKAATG